MILEAIAVQLTSAPSSTKLKTYKPKYIHYDIPTATEAAYLWHV